MYSYTVLLTNIIGVLSVAEVSMTDYFDATDLIWIIRHWDASLVRDIDVRY